jgi:hypothetical protein
VEKEEETSKVHRLRYYGRIYVIRGGLEGSWKLPTDRPVNLHLSTVNPNSSSSFTPSSSTTNRDEYLIAERIINLDDNLLFPGDRKASGLK